MHLTVGQEGIVAHHDNPDEHYLMLYPYASATKHTLSVYDRGRKAYFDASLEELTRLRDALNTYISLQDK